MHRGMTLAARRDCVSLLTEPCASVSGAGATWCGRGAPPPRANIKQRYQHQRVPRGVRRRRDRFRSSCIDCFRKSLFYVMETLVYFPPLSLFYQIVGASVRRRRLRRHALLRAAGGRRERQPRRGRRDHDRRRDVRGRRRQRAQQSAVDPTTATTWAAAPTSRASSSRRSKTARRSTARRPSSR